MNCFEYLNSELNKIKTLETERSYYPILKEFLIRFAKEELEIKNDINVISEASSKVHDSKVGFPDLTVQIKNYDYQTIGWAEVKLPKDNLNDDKFKEQFNRYTDSLENMLFTNLREWTLYQWDEKGKPKKIEEILFDSTATKSDTKAIKKLLGKFFNGKILEVKTPKQLALALARKTRLLSQQIEENIEEATANDEKRNPLIELKKSFSRTLIKNLENHQFANMAAETIAYSFFLAALEHEKRGKSEPLTLGTTLDYLPESVPILYDLYRLISETAKNIESIRLIVNSIIEQFAKADMAKISATVSKHEAGQDPVIHFYEPFLAEYDPKEREARGVYYTPKPVVDYIVKSVDWILREKFSKKAGIEDREVYLLDPATGTGTFLMSAIELIHENKVRQFGSLGSEIVKKEFVRVAENHILKHFFGFELMIAPYAISHLKLTMLLEEFGFDFILTKNDNDPDNDRLKIYLANTLDEPLKYENTNQKQLDFDEFTFYQHVSHESRDASEVKSDKPVMAIVGNPPYSGHSSNLSKIGKEFTWIGKLVDDYYFVDGKRLDERNPKWIQDDYVKFIRFAQWKIKQTGEGVIGYITNHAYLDNPTFRGMRQQLMQNFNEIYILDLHGSGLKKERTPEDNKDENVFNIQAGVAIIFLIKYKDKDDCKIYRADKYGNKAEKLDWLGVNKIDTTEYQKIEPKKEFYLFKRQDEQMSEEYNKYFGVNKIFKLNSVGIVTGRDDFVIDFEQSLLEKRIKLLIDDSISDQYLDEKFSLNSGKYLQLNEVRKLLREEHDLTNYYKKISYRPFDERIIFYNKSLIGRAREKVMKQMKNDNLALVTCRQTNNFWWHTFVVQNIVDDSFVSNKTRERGYVFPLFLYENDQKISNISEDFKQKISTAHDHTFDLNQTSQVFDYIYGIFYHPKYRQRYAEQLKIDFPRIPLPSQVIETKLFDEKVQDPKEVFEKMSALGNRLRNLHLLTDPIFEDQSKWNVKIGGTKPIDLEDWKVTKVEYKQSEKRVYVNNGQYFEGIEPEVWSYYIGGYQVLDKWLKDRKKAERCLSLDDLMHYMKIVVSLRETIKETEKFK